MPQTLSVRNLTRGTVVVSNGGVADNYWTRFKGLMGVRALDEGSGLLLKNETAIHTFGMRIPIDVIYLDERSKALRLTPAMPPSRLGPLVRGTRNVLELPAGTLARTKTQQGDQLEIIIV
jgi:uncharacterized membrane protein (UPF0127 family)